MDTGETLVQFVGLVLPVTIISLRFLYGRFEGSNLEQKLGDEDPVATAAYWFAGVLVVGAWFGIADVVVPAWVIPFRLPADILARVGYVIVGFGLLIPVWLLRRFKNSTGIPIAGE